MVALAWARRGNRWHRQHVQRSTVAGFIAFTKVSVCAAV